MTTESSGPESLAPFDVVVTITNMKQDEVREAGEKLYQELQRAGSKFCLTIATSARA